MRLSLKNIMMEGNVHCNEFMRGFICFARKESIEDYLWEQEIAIDDFIKALKDNHKWKKWAEENGFPVRILNETQKTKAFKKDSEVCPMCKSGGIRMEGWEGTKHGVKIDFACDNCYCDWTIMSTK